MFVDVSFNGKATKSVMVDTWAIHNFVSEAKTTWLGLRLVSDVIGKIRLLTRRH